MTTINVEVDLVIEDQSIDETVEYLNHSPKFPNRMKAMNQNQHLIIAICDLDDINDGYVEAEERVQKAFDDMGLYAFVLGSY